MPEVAVVVTAASPARHLPALIRGLRTLGWKVTVCATASATTAFADRWPAGLRAEAASFDLDAILVAPATFHTVSALAAGINDTASLQLVNRWLGRIPVCVWPHVDHGLAVNPLLARNLQTLTDVGVQVLSTAVCEGGCTADAHWPRVLEAFHALTSTQAVSGIGGDRVG